MAILVICTTENGIDIEIMDIVTNFETGNVKLTREKENWSVSLRETMKGAVSFSETS